MSKRPLDDIIEEIAAELKKRARSLDIESYQDLKQQPIDTTITTADDKKVRKLVFDKLAPIIADGELYQRDTEMGVREYSFTVRYPNEFDNDDISTLMYIDEVACVLVKPGEAPRSFIVTIPYTRSKTTKAAIIKKTMPDLPESQTSTGDKMLDHIIKRIDSCVERDKDKPDQVTRSKAEVLGITTLSFPLMATVTNGSVYGILSLGIINKVAFAASETSVYPILKTCFLT